MAPTSFGPRRSSARPRRKSCPTRWSRVMPARTRAAHSAVAVGLGVGVVVASALGVAVALGVGLGVALAPVVHAERTRATASQRGKRAIGHVYSRPWVGLRACVPSRDICRLWACRLHIHTELT